MAFSKCLSIGGLLRSRKSSVMNILEEKLDTFNFLHEPINLLEKYQSDKNINPILEMYEDPVKNMGLFQAYILEEPRTRSTVLSAKDIVLYGRESE